MALIVILAAYHAARANGSIEIADYALNIYRVKSLSYSQGRSSDLLMFHGSERTSALEVVKNSRDIPKGSIVRGLKVSTSTMKLLAAMALGKIQSMTTQNLERQNSIKAALSAAVRQFVGEISELRGALQKFAQLGFVINGDLPYEWRDELAKGLTYTQPMSTAAVTKVLVEAYGEISKVFGQFDNRPIACGSIGQVHRAVLLGGENVCVKIKYNGIESAIKADFRNVRAFLPIANALLPNQMIKPMISDWEESALRECDLKNESLNYRLSNAALRNLAVIIPGSYEELSRDNLLVTEFVDGQDFFSFLQTSNQNQRNSIAVSIWRSLYVLLEHGLFREDIQPANYMIKDNKLVILDLGSLQHAADIEGLKSHLTYMHAFATGDYKSVASLLVQDGWGDEQTVKEEVRAIVEVFGRPFRGEFEFTESYSMEVYRMMTRTLTKKMRMPSSSRFLLRIFWSLYSLLTMLRARADWSQELAAELKLDDSWLKERSS